MRICIASARPEDYTCVRSSPLLLSSENMAGREVHNCSELLPKLSDDHTDILIVDTQLPGGNVFDSLHALRELRKIEIIIVAESRDFDCAYQAMKLHASEILIRPLTTEMITNAMLGAVRHLSSSRTIFGAKTPSSRSCFARNLVQILSGFDTMQSIEDINRIYGTAFQPGLFQVVTLVLDFPVVDRIEELRDLLWQSLHAFIEQTLIPLTFDLIHAMIYNEIRLILNYPPEHADAIAQFLPVIILRTEQLCQDSPGMSVFMGIGLPYPEIAQLRTSAAESKAGVWTRLRENSSQTGIHTFSENIIPETDQIRLQELQSLIRESIRNLNATALTEQVNALFQLPETVLGSEAGREAILDPVKYLFNRFRRQISSFCDVNTTYQQFHISILSVQNFTQLKYRYLAAFSSIFEKLLAGPESKLDRSIEQAKRYIVQNYKNNPTLEEVAAAVHLSPSYFSRLFKQKTGIRFTDYCIDLKINFAKKLLTQTNYRVNEIASSVGISDQRYFSKIFKAQTGVTPSEYRNIHSTL